MKEITSKGIEEIGEGIEEEAPVKEEEGRFSWMLCEVKAFTFESFSFTGQVNAFEGRGRVIASRVIEEGSEAKEIDREVKEEGGQVIPFLSPSSCFKARGKDIAGESITLRGKSKEIEGETVTFRPAPGSCRRPGALPHRQSLVRGTEGIVRRDDGQKVRTAIPYRRSVGERLTPKSGPYAIKAIFKDKPDKPENKRGP